VHKSELEVLIEGEIAEGGGALTVVLEFVLDVTVLVVVDSVTIGSADKLIAIKIAGIANIILLSIDISHMWF